MTYWACCTTLATAVATRREPSRHGEAIAVERFFMTAISRHGDTHRHLATRINLWRHPSPYGDTHHHNGDRRRKGETAARTWSHFAVQCCTYAVQEMATAMLSLLVCRALVILVALRRYASPFRDMRRRSATALALRRGI